MLLFNDLHRRREVFPHRVPMQPLIFLSPFSEFCIFELLFFVVPYTRFYIPGQVRTISFPLPSTSRIYIHLHLHPAFILYHHTLTLLCLALLAYSPRSERRIARSTLQTIIWPHTTGNYSDERHSQSYDENNENRKYEAVPFLRCKMIMFPSVLSFFSPLALFSIGAKTKTKLELGCTK
ncbi:hypothetical protein EV127DRAFT_144411 [Xylaria flabelliformis]|nr:hypothetical protein EV127DRAFT_144411 [Xylaria flabelliformis]